jgi:hypothetical protein
MKCIQRFVIGFGLTVTLAITSTGATTQGSVGDGTPSVAYIATTGEMIVQPDGIPIGLFDIRSDTEIFTANAVFPPQELLPNIDTASRKIWVTQPANALTDDFSLGIIAPSGLSLDSSSMI